MWGIVVGIAWNHVVVDGKGIADFLNCWAVITRGQPLSVDPCLDRTILSPTQPLPAHISHPALHQNQSRNVYLQYQEPISYQSFCFEPKKLSQLKKIAREKGFDAFPTSFEVISALLWIFRTKAFKIEPHKTTKLLAAVDIWSKLNPPLPECFFGNGIVMSYAESTAEDLVEKKPFSFAVKLVQESIKAVDEGYVRSAIDYYELTRGKYGMNTGWISKWNRLPFYDVDFGWGKPQQVAPASLLNNLDLTLCQEKDGDDIILSVGLPQSVMQIFQELMQAELNRKY